MLQGRVGVRCRCYRGEPCSRDGCERRSAERHHLCPTHSRRKSRGQDMETPIRPRLANLRDEYGRKQCASCKEWKPESSFCKRGDSSTLRSACRKCNSVLAHGISWARYQEMLSAQNHCCALCGEPFVNSRCYVDHSHECCSSGTSCGACVRALLCPGCNTLVGYAEHRNIRDALRYVEKYAGAK